MKIHELGPAPGSVKKRKRVGRGPGSGHGGTSCKGNKGQRARSGGGSPRGFEGGQMPLQRRLPKRGFKNPFRKEYNILNVGELNQFGSDAVVDAGVLIQSGLIKRLKDGVKILGGGEVTHALKVKVDRASLSARAKIEAAGGSVELL